MKPTLAKILSRFNGDARKAVLYCLDITVTYPQLRKEYERYARVLGNLLAFEKAKSPLESKI